MSLELKTWKKQKAGNKIYYHAISQIAALPLNWFDEFLG